MYWKKTSHSHSLKTSSFQVNLEKSKFFFLGYDVTADSIIADQTGWKHTPMTQFTRSEPRITFMNDMDFAISTAPEGIGDSLAIVGIFVRVPTPGIRPSPYTRRGRYTIELIRLGASTNGKLHRSKRKQKYLFNADSLYSG